MPGVSYGMSNLQLRHADFLVAARMQDLVLRPGIEQGTPALGAQSLTYWTTREVSIYFKFVDIWKVLLHCCNLVPI